LVNSSFSSSGLNSNKPKNKTQNTTTYRNCLRNENDKTKQKKHTHTHTKKERNRENPMQTERTLGLIRVAATWCQHPLDELFFFIRFFLFFVFLNFFGEHETRKAIGTSVCTFAIGRVARQ